MFRLLFFGIFIFTLVSCRHNKMKLDEQPLADKIMLEEQELELERLGNIVPKNATIPTTAQLKEIRNIDPTNPPIVLDMISGRNNPRSINASELFKGIKHIRLEPLSNPDFYEFGAAFLISSEFIYGISIYGIAQYDKNGNFLKYIVENDTYITRYGSGYYIPSEQYNMFVGGVTLQGIGKPRLVNNKLYYKYENRPEKFSCLMSFEETSDMTGLIMPKTIENTNLHIRGLGKKIMDLEFNDKLELLEEISPIDNNHIGFSSATKVLGKEYFLTLKTTFGDTICAFSDPDPMPGFSKLSRYIGVKGDNYYFNGIQRIRQAYNDTIFTVLPPNRLIPKYVFDFGTFRFDSSIHGIGISAFKDKFIPSSFFESNRFLFITYSKDYASINNAKSGTLKYTRLIFNKSTNEITYIYVDADPVKASAPEINVENDLDNNPFFWPKAISTSGIPFTWFSGKDLKQIMVNGEFAHLEDKEYIITVYEE
jgi:hypothetical protein